MFEKQKVSFKSKDVFETKFQTNIDTCFCVVSKLLFNNIINVDGSIDVEKSVLVKKYELWSYIYFLYYFNNKTIDEFISMTTPRTGKASAVLFYDTVMKTVDEKTTQSTVVTPFSINSLIYFINIIIHKYESKLYNPIISYINKLLEKEIIPSLGSIAIKTGNSSGNVKIVTNQQNVANANVKVRLSMKEK